MPVGILGRQPVHGKLKSKSSFAMLTSDKSNQEQRSLLSIPFSFRKIIGAHRNQKVHCEQKRDF